MNIKQEYPCFCKPQYKYRVVSAQLISLGTACCGATFKFCVVFIDTVTGLYITHTHIFQNWLFRMRSYVGLEFFSVGTFYKLALQNRLENSIIY